MKKILTLSILMTLDSLYLGMKKRGFGVGKWNGFGGKIEENETREEAAVREIYEEAGVTVLQSDLEKMGEVDFCFPNRPDWNQRVIFYRTFIWRGELIETEEMRPAFFRFDTIPYSEMWPGDDLWLPYLIRGEMFGGEIHFTGEGDGVEWSNIYLEK